MGQVKLLKIHTNGVPVEFDAAADDITLNSFTVQGGGPVLSGTGLDAQNQDVSDVKDLIFNDPTTGTVNQTAGDLIIDNIMAKERDNEMTTAGAILFPVVADSAGEVDALRLPQIAGAPSATPTATGEGFIVWDSTGKKLWAWDGTAWDDLSSVSAANAIDDTYTADEALAARDCVYISAANSVSKADADADLTSQAIGFATAAALDTASVTVRKFGVLNGFSGLTVGARYFLSATAGAITATVPSGSGNSIVQVGYAKSATALDIRIESLGRRAA